MQEVLKSEKPSIKQKAISLTAAEFAERVAGGDPDIFHQRFTVRADDFEAPKSSEAVTGIESNQQTAELPQVGEVIIAKINGRLTEATLAGFFLDENEKQVAIVEGLDGKRIRADLLAFTPEIQEHLRTDFKTQEFGGDVLATVQINNPHAPEVVTEVNESMVFLTREQRRAPRQVEPVEGPATDQADTHSVDMRQEVAALEIDSDKYGALVRGETEGSVEAAAMYPVETEEEKSLRDWQARDSIGRQSDQIQTAAHFYRAGHK